MNNKREYSVKILSGIDEISELTDNLLDMKRIDSAFELLLEKFVPSDYLTSDRSITATNQESQNSVLRE
jgi:signal transduction histidine kinase